VGVGRAWESVNGWFGWSFGCEEVRLIGANRGWDWREVIAV